MRLVYVPGRCVATGRAHRCCEFSPRGTSLSPVGRGILRMSSIRSSGSAPRAGDRSDAKDFARIESRRENLAVLCCGAGIEPGRSIRILHPSESRSNVPTE
jgi:hypothetical protein